jgi:hypothetical protein
LGGAALIVIVKKLSPDVDFSAVDGLHELGCVPLYKPRREGILQRLRLKAESSRQALCN